MRQDKSGNRIRERGMRKCLELLSQARAQSAEHARRSRHRGKGEAKSSSNEEDDGLMIISSSSSSSHAHVLERMLKRVSPERGFGDAVEYWLSPTAEPD